MQILVATSKITLPNNDTLEEVSLFGRIMRDDRRLVVDSIRSVDLTFLPLTTKDTDDGEDISWQTRIQDFKALFDPSNKDNTDLALYGDGQHHTKERIALKLHRWGDRGNNGEALKCFLIYNNDNQCIGYVNIGNSLVTTQDTDGNSHPIYECGTLYNIHATKEQKVIAMAVVNRGYFKLMSDCIIHSLDAQGNMIYVAREGNIDTCINAGFQVIQDDEVQAALLTQAKSRFAIHRRTDEGDDAIQWTDEARPVEVFHYKAQHDIHSIVSITGDACDASIPD